MKKSFKNNNNVYNVRYLKQHFKITYNNIQLYIMEKYL